MKKTYEVIKKPLGDAPTGPVRAALIKADSLEHAEWHWLENRKSVGLGSYTYSHVAQVPDSEWLPHDRKVIRMYAESRGEERQVVLDLVAKFRAAYAANDKVTVTQSVDDLMNRGQALVVQEVWNEVIRDVSASKELHVAQWYHEAFGPRLLEAMQVIFFS